MAAPEILAKAGPGEPADGQVRMIPGTGGLGFLGAHIVRDTNTPQPEGHDPMTVAAGERAARIEHRAASTPGTGVAERVAPAGAA